MHFDGLALPQFLHPPHLCHGLLDDGVGEARFEGIAQGHEFFNFGDKASWDIDLKN
jgi:hypothetical protein